MPPMLSGCKRPRQRPGAQIIVSIGLLVLVGWNGTCVLTTPMLLVLPPWATTKILVSDATSPFGVNNTVVYAAEFICFAPLLLAKTVHER